MKKSAVEIALFYCTRQRERVNRIWKELEASGGARLRHAVLPCSGKLEVFQLTKALESGANGVALFACPEGDCQYIVGSTRGKGRVAYAGRILEEIGLERDRIRRFVLESQPRPENGQELSGWVEKIRTLMDIHQEVQRKGSG